MSAFDKRTYIFLLLLCALFACEGEVEEPMEEPEDPVTPVVVTCDTPNPGFALAGDMSDSICLTQTAPDFRMEAFRAEASWTFDLDGNGSPDIRFDFDDESYGVAGPARGFGTATPLSTRFEIAADSLLGIACSRRNIDWVNPDGSIEYMTVDSRLCHFYTEEQLAEVDTVLTVGDYSGVYARSFAAGAQIDDAANWTNETVFMNYQPYVRGFYPCESVAYLGIRKSFGNGEYAYGWLALEDRCIYGQAIIFHQSALFKN